MRVRYITVPPHAEFPYLNDRGLPDVRVVAFTDLLRDCWLNDARFSGPTAAGQRGLDILKAFWSAPWEWRKPGDVAELHEDDWKALCEAMTAPSSPQSVLQPPYWRLAKMAGWFEAVTDAKEEKPCPSP